MGTRALHMYGYHPSGVYGAHAAGPMAGPFGHPNPLMGRYGSRHGAGYGVARPVHLDSRHHFGAISELRNSHSHQIHAIETEFHRPCVDMIDGRPCSAAERIRRSSPQRTRPAEDCAPLIEAEPEPMLEVAASTVTDGTVRMKSPGMPNLSDVSSAELDNYMRRLFKIGDRDGNGSLDKIELQDLLKKSGFNLSFDTIGQMMKTADTNGDGLIQFDEFVRAVAYLQNGDEGFPTPAAPGMPNLADVPAAQLSRYMAKLFQIGDTNGDGVLDADELESLLKKSGFNLSSEIIGTLMQKADINGDGVISETEFCKAGVALQQVGFPVEKPAAPPMPDLADVEPAQLMRYMERLFKIGDKNNDGVLDALELRDLLQKSGFNLDQQTIATVMDAVDVNRDGVIQFSEFCHAMSILINTMSQEEENVMPDIKSVNKLELRSYFMRLFKIADTNGDGVLQPAEMEALLRKSGFGFDSATIQEMVRLADANGDGVIEYNEFVPAMMAVAQFSRHVPEVRADMPKMSSVPPAQLELYFQKLFSVGDKDKNGVLDAIEFRDLLRASGFGFDDATISKILREADTNNDGVLQFDEFLVAMSRLVAQLPRPI